MTDEEIMQGLENACNSATGAFGWTVPPYPILRDYIQRVKAENDELTRKTRQLEEELRATLSELETVRSRLEKAVELPCKVGDEVFAIVGLTPGVEEYRVTSIEIHENIIWIHIESLDWGIKTSVTLKSYGVRWFTELEAAEKRLAELGGEK